MTFDTSIIFLVWHASERHAAHVQALALRMKRLVPWNSQNNMQQGVCIMLYYECHHSCSESVLWHIHVNPCIHMFGKLYMMMFGKQYIKSTELGKLSSRNFVCYISPLCLQPTRDIYNSAEPVCLVPG